MGAGQYYRSFTWLRYTLTKDTTTGQEVPSYVDNGTLWGYIPVNKKLKQESDYGATYNRAEVEIRIRNWVEIDPKDRLVDAWFGGLYKIKGRHYGENEIILEASEQVDERA